MDDKTSGGLDEVFRFIDYLSGVPTLEVRTVARTKSGDLIVGTIYAPDRQCWETGIRHPEYKRGMWVIVELYPTEKDAQSGHNKWKTRMTTPPLPDSLTGVGWGPVKAREWKWKGNDAGRVEGR